VGPRLTVLIATSGRSGINEIINAVLENCYFERIVRKLFYSVLPIKYQM
jgi:hypothetical protein